VAAAVQQVIFMQEMSTVKKLGAGAAVFVLIPGTGTAGVAAVLAVAAYTGPVTAAAVVLTTIVVVCAAYLLVRGQHRVDPVNSVIQRYQR